MYIFTTLGILLSVVVRHEILVYSSSLPPKTKELKYISPISLNDINRTKLRNTFQDSFVLSETIEKFAKRKSLSHDFHIWHAPKPSIGEPWPKPASINQSWKINHVTNMPIFKVYNTDCKLVLLAMERYKKRIFVDKFITHVSIKDLPNTSNICRPQEMIRKCNIEYITITITKCSKKEVPNESMNELYTLVTKDDHIDITSEETWGMLRALETLAQLLFFVIGDKENWLGIRNTVIYDAPRYKYRGLMIDTSRHFIPLNIILDNLNAMEMNKLNVFHWHLTDDQSFPFKSISHPELYLKGAFSNDMVYDHFMIRAVVEYARQRGIRVIPEIDIPGHTGSWAKSHSELMSECPESSTEGLYGTMNPILLQSYSLLDDLYLELMSLFPDKYIHIGLDEVGMGCWMTDPAIKTFMASNNIKDVKILFSFFVIRLQQMINSNYPNKKLVVWQEAYERTLNLSKNSIIQIWRNQLENIDIFTKSNLPLIFSTNFYLDHIKYGPQWVQYYSSLFGKVKYLNFIGGEACMWNEYQSKETMFQTIWPSACAVSEVLWRESQFDMLEVAMRIEEQRCRMLRSGLTVGVASGPGECAFLNLSKSTVRITFPSNAIYEKILFKNGESAFVSLLIFVLGCVFNRLIETVRHRRKIFPIVLSILFIIMYFLYFHTSNYSVDF